MLWVTRQFLDGYAQYPLRFAFRDISTGDILYIYDLNFKPGTFISPTSINRGHLQPIENYLGQYSTDEYYQKIFDLNALISSRFATIGNNVSSMESRMDASIAMLNSRILSVENRLPLYAPLSGASFTNPRANSPAAADNSERIATTENVRNFVAQYPFPPKNPTNFTVYPAELKIDVYWSDPNDFIYDNMTLSEWAGTKLVYRTDRYPNNQNDGTIATVSTYRNQYQTYPFTFENARAGTTYYMQLFPYSINDVYNASILNRNTAIPLVEMQVLDNLSYARYEHAAAADGQGRILFAGGYTSSGATNIVEIYGMYGQHLTTTLSVARYNLAASTDSAGNAAFAGGYVQGGIASNVIDIYSSSGANSTSTLSMSRYSLAAAKENGGGILFGGGYGDGSYHNVVDKLTPGGYVSTITPLGAGRSNLAAAFNSGNTVFAGGILSDGINYSNNVDRYDSAGIHTRLDDLSAARAYLSGTATGDGSTLFAGGYSGAWFDNVDRYNITGIRSNLEPLFSARYRMATSTDGNGMALFAGGRNALGVYAIIDRYSATGIKSLSVNLSNARSHMSAATDILGNVVVGGGSGVGGFSSAVDRYTIQN